MRRNLHKAWAGLFNRRREVEQGEPPLAVVPFTILECFSARLSNSDSSLGPLEDERETLLCRESIEFQVDDVPGVRAFRLLSHSVMIDVHATDADREEFQKRNVPMSKVIMFIHGNNDNERVRFQRELDDLCRSDSQEKIRNQLRSRQELTIGKLESTLPEHVLVSIHKDEFVELSREDLIEILTVTMKNMPDKRVFADKFTCAAETKIRTPEAHRRLLAILGAEATPCFKVARSEERLQVVHSQTDEPLDNNGPLDDSGPLVKSAAGPGA